VLTLLVARYAATPSLNVIGQPVCWLTIITRWQAHTRIRCHMRCLPLTPLSPASSGHHIELLLIAKSWLLTPASLAGEPWGLQ
jgi:hypothetical protein